jgi:hypothetical protein
MVKVAYVNPVGNLEKSINDKLIELQESGAGLIDIKFAVSEKYSEALIIYEDNVINDE